MDTVFIDGLRLRLVIGVFEWERHIRQTVLLDLEAEADLRRAAQSDELRHTVDYKAIAQRLKEHAESRPFSLLETLAEEMATIVLQEFPAVMSVKVKLSKPYAVRYAQTVGVIIKRSGERVQDESS